MPDVFGPLEVGEIRPDIEALLLRDVVIDADDVVPVGVLRVLALGVVVGAVHRAGLIRRVPQCGDLRGRRVDPVGGDDIVRQRLAAEPPVARGLDGIRIVNLIARSEGEQTGEIARAHGRGRHRLDYPGRRVEAPDTLIAVHEECPVVAVVQLGNDDRAAHVAAPAIQTGTAVCRPRGGSTCSP